MTKRADNPSGPDGQNDPEGHSNRDRGHDGQDDSGSDRDRDGDGEQTGRDSDPDAGRDGQSGHHGEAGRQGESGRQGEDGHEGQNGHRDSHEAGDRARHVDCDPNDLISAIIDANSDGGGTLTLAEKCTYTLTANQDGNGLPEIVQPITIHGNGATIARAAGADQFRIFQVGTGGDLTLRHLTLTRGKTAVDQEGGAINVAAGGRLDLDHTTLHNNTVDDIGSDEAGAIYNEGITTIRNSTISGNSADDGSAVYNGGKLDITTSKITGNVSDPDDGIAAVYNDSGGTVTVSKSLFSYNYAHFGGGIYSNGGVTDIDKSAFKYNYAHFGGGIYHDFGSLHVRRSTIAYNTANSEGGGGLNLKESAVIEDSKIYGNTATDSDGGGIYTDLGTDETVAIRGTVISGNQAPGDGCTGGGIYISTGDQVTLTDVKVTDNTSDTEPGGIDNNGTVTTYGKIKIIDNVPTNCQGSANPVPNCFG